MNTKFNKIAKRAAIGIFFMALFFNVKLSLTDPFLQMDSVALAQSSSSSSSEVSPDCGVGGPYICGYYDKYKFLPAYFSGWIGR